MSALASINTAPSAQLLNRRAIKGDSPNVFTDIYQEDANIVIWQRDLTLELTTAVNEFIVNHPNKAAKLVVTPENTDEVLRDKFGDSNSISVLSDDITLLVDMFCCVFDLKRAGLRLAVLDRAMCPRFHIDRIPCRLVTTYQGIATQWLDHNAIDRSKLGAGNQGKSDEQSGLFNNLKDINCMSAGDVALLKGENWDETEGAGLVHRSPPMALGERRLLLTLDFIS